ncbi:MAG: hypothetical protein J6T10_20445 [Methanobrevibacter sp.]|nr:hypothetical protein [Methanobrevibacter sp.]
MKRMIDSETIEKLDELLKKVNIVNGLVSFDESIVVDGVPLYTDEDSGGIKRLALNGLVSNGNVEVNSDLTATTLRQTESNWELDIGELVLANKSGITAHSSFSKFQLIGNLLIVAINGYLENTTAEAIANVGFSEIQFTLPEPIAKKIIDVDGKSLDELGSSVVTGDTFILDYASISFFRLVNDTPKDGGRLLINASLSSFPAGARRDFSGRLILSIL